jgi:large subunit ribosomal protein L10
MNKQQKELVIKTLHDDFRTSNGSFLVGVKGLSVKQTQTLRSELRKNGGQLKVAKVRLVKRAISETSGEALTPFLKEQIAVVFAQKESPAVAKVLYEFSKANAGLNLIAGCLDAKLLDANEVKFIATLPSREVLLAHLCATLMAPVSALARALNAKREKDMADQAPTTASEAASQD